MRSLFSKILIWYTVVLIASMAVTTFGKLYTFRQSSPHPDGFSTLLTVEMNEARLAWEGGGKPALGTILRRFREESRASAAILTSGDGLDLLDGTDRSALVWRVKHRPPFSFSGGSSGTFARLSADGRYCFFLIGDAGEMFAGVERRKNLWMLALAILPCWVLAYRLTAPLRRLEKAVTHFGKGELDVRAQEHRHDEIGRLAGSFNRMADQIQRLLAAEQRLLLDISHELRSPLARMNVALELARKKGGQGVPLDRIQKEADRLDELVSDLLEVTSAEAGAETPAAAPVRLDELIREIAESGEIEAGVRSCAISIQTTPLTIAADGELLRRSIENVIRNALRYAPAGSNVEVILRSAGERALIRVRDYGPGVPPDALNHLFDPFFRVEADRDRRSGGKGLGLSIARRAVELHKGAIRAFNADPGLAVEIELSGPIVLEARDGAAERVELSGRVG